MAYPPQGLKGKMKNTKMTAKRICLFLAFAILLTGMIVSVSAQTLIAQDDESSITHFWNNLLHYNQQFSVVGNARTCGTTGGNANYQWQVDAGKKIDGSQGVYSGTVGSCTNGIYDIFTSGWTAFAEVKQFSGTSLTTVGGWSCGANGPCSVQAYCCPKAEPTSQSDCGVIPFFTFKTVQCTDTISNYKGTGITAYWCKGSDGVLENSIPYLESSYKYCKQNEVLTCYYKRYGSCSELNKQSYDKALFPNSCPSYHYEDGRLYSTLSDCSNSGSACDINSECPSNGICSGGTCSSGCTSNWVTGAWSACSGGTQTRDVHDSNYCSPSTGTQPASTQSCTVGATCTDGILNQGETQIDCGGPNCAPCGGGGGCTSNQACSVGSCAGTQTCSGGVLGGCVKTDANCGVTPQECKSASQDPEIKAEIVDIAMTDSNGGAIPSGALKPGDMVKVSFKVRAKIGDLKQSNKFIAVPVINPSQFCIPQGIGYLCWDTSKDYLIEAGIIPYETAKSWKLPNLPTFSIWDNLFATSVTPTDCCSVGMPNIKAYTVRVSGQNLIWNSLGKLWDSIVNKPSAQDSDYVDIIQDVTIKVPDETTKDKCPVSGQDPSIYWGGNKSEYVLYIAVKNGCYAQDGVKTGFCNLGSREEVFDIDLSGNGTGGLRDDGDDCLVNSQCKSSVCKEHKCSGSGSEGSGLTYYKKTSLTKDEITPATTPMLFASSCYKPDECLERENYTVSCSSIASLRADGTISTEGAVSSLLDYGKGIVVGATGGAVVGAGAGVWVCRAGLVAMFIAAPETTAAKEVVTLAAKKTSEKVITTIVTKEASTLTCATWGAYAGGALGGFIGSLIIKMDKDADPLAKAFNAKDASSIGICTASEPAFDFSGIICKIGKAVPIFKDCIWSGVSIIIAGLFILTFIMGALKSK